MGCFHYPSRLIKFQRFFSLLYRYGFPDKVFFSAGSGCCLLPKIGQRIRAARLEKGYSQADLGALVGCSNNHMSHVEVGQTKVSLAMLLKLAFVLEKNFDYFLLDTPYAKCDSIIDNEIAAKLKKCNVTTLITVGKLIDVLIDQQEMIKKAELD